MSSIVKFAVLGAGLIALGACGKSGIYNRESPDEFAIGRSAPLVVPPDYNMAPPRPGQPRPLENDSQTRAIEALFGEGARVPAKSSGEQQLLNGADAQDVDPTARSTAGDPNTSVVDKGALLKTILDTGEGNGDANIAQVSTGG